MSIVGGTIVNVSLFMLGVNATSNEAGDGTVTFVQEAVGWGTRLGTRCDGV